MATRMRRQLVEKRHQADHTIQQVARKFSRQSFRPRGLVSFISWLSWIGMKGPDSEKKKPTCDMEVKKSKSQGPY